MAKGIFVTNRIRQLGTEVHACVFLFKLGYLIEPQYFAIH